MRVQVEDDQLALAYIGPSVTFSFLLPPGSSQKKEGEYFVLRGQRCLGDDLVNTKFATMKILWVVSALILGCWRASAYTGKAFLSAMFVENKYKLLWLRTLNICFYPLITIILQQLRFQRRIFLNHVWGSTFVRIQWRTATLSLALALLGVANADDNAGNTFS